MDKTRLGIGLMVGVLVVQALASVLWSADATLTGVIRLVLGSDQLIG